MKKAIVITDLNIKANFKLSKEGGGALSFDALVRVLSRLSLKKVSHTDHLGQTYIKRLR